MPVSPTAGALGVAFTGLAVLEMTIVGDTVRDFRPAMGTGLNVAALARIVLAAGPLIGCAVIGTVI